MRLIPDFGRLGIKELIVDHYSTFYVIDKHNKRRKSKFDYFLFIILPLAVSLATWLLDIRLQGLPEIIAGTSIFTALLFGLLVHIFSVGVSINGRKQTDRWLRLETLLDETRANISYTCGIGLVLVAVCMCAAALAPDIKKGVHPLVSGVIIFLLIHMFMTLFMVLKRIRSSYFEIAE